MGVWIETTLEEGTVGETAVTPCVGVWIETFDLSSKKLFTAVTPCVGVWIETFITNRYTGARSHTLRGCVD